MKRYRISAAADADLRNIAAHTVQMWRTNQRDAYIRELFDAFERLAKTPDIAQSIDAIRPGYRKFPQGSHVIFFRTSATQRIEIVRVLHKRMDADWQINSH